MQTITWFELSENKTDIKLIVSFLENLPKNLKMMISRENSTFLKNIFENIDSSLDSALFRSSFNETIKVYNAKLTLEKHRLILDKIDNTSKRKDKFILDLQDSGLYGNPLKMKAAVLNSLWTKLIRISNNIINIGIEVIRNALLDFLAYLDSILGSLSIIFSFLEPLIEMKQLIEALIKSFNNENNPQNLALA